MDDQKKSNLIREFNWYVDVTDLMGALMAIYK